ncbi:MAG: inorganic phosphate transporter, partial [Calditrichaeota bacterium]
LSLMGVLNLSGKQQLFLIGGLAIATGVYTYSERVMVTVGRNLFRLTPEAALVVVLANAMVLFLFASKSLESWLLAHGLPPIPLVPVSSTQAVIGALIGMGLVKRAKNINYGILGEIALGWVSTPIAAGVIAFISLFFLQNVFNLPVSR